MFWIYDKFGWLVGPSEEQVENSTAIEPPSEVPEGLTPAFRGRDWVLLNKDHYMATHYPELHAVSVVITSCVVDEAHSKDPDLELEFNNGDITIPAGATLTVGFELQQLGAVVPVDRKWKMPCQPLDIHGSPNGPCRWVFARVKAGVGSLAYTTREGVSEKILFNEATINSGLPENERLAMPQTVFVYVME